MTKNNREEIDHLRAKNEADYVFLMGEATRGKEPKVFDWAKAKALIQEKNPKVAWAGLLEDWSSTRGDVLKTKEPR